MQWSGESEGSVCNEDFSIKSNFLHRQIAQNASLSGNLWDYQALLFDHFYFFDSEKLDNVETRLPSCTKID